MRSSHQILFASNNRDKFIELEAIFKAYPEIELVPANEVIRNTDKIALVENHTTYIENATAKARLANQGAHYPCLGDDSGLEVELLGGKPGPRSARYAIAKAGEAQSEANIQKLLSELRGAPMDKRKARFVTALALVIEGILITAEGTLDGMIAEAPVGTNGFGYDSVFIPSGTRQTLAQLRDDQKNAISHRAKAVHALMSQVKAKGITFARP
jgi:XTP/dITP diphosphohydrolase